MDAASFVVRMAEVLYLPPDRVSPSTLLDSENWDSSAMLAAIAAIDEAFGVSVSGDRLARCTRVQDVLDLIDEAVSAAP